MSLFGRPRKRSIPSDLPVPAWRVLGRLFRGDTPLDSLNHYREIFPMRSVVVFTCGIRMVLAELGAGFGARVVRLIDPVSMVCERRKPVDLTAAVLAEPRGMVVTKVYELRNDCSAAASDFQIRRHLKSQMPKFRLDRRRGRKPWH